MTDKTENGHEVRELTVDELEGANGGDGVSRGGCGTLTLSNHNTYAGTTWSGAVTLASSATVGP